MAKLSACIISFNEERKIEDCLKSLVPVADEIIVVDSNSTDATVEIARRYTDKVYDQAFLGHIEQKNLAVEKAGHDWIISLDCDERLDPELTRSILEIKDRLDDHDAYRVSRKTFYVDRWLDHVWYPERRIRLFNRRTARWAGRNPHDAVLVDGTDIVDLRGDVLHYSIDSISAHLRQIDSFTSIAAREMIERGVKVSVLTPVVRSLWAFFRVYILRSGWRDGFAGLLIAFLAMVYCFVKYAKVIRPESPSGDHAGIFSSPKPSK